MPTKYCPTCEQEKDVELFHRYRNSKDGRYYRCKECQKKNTKPQLNRVRNIETNRSQELLRKYGISSSEYQKLYLEQNGLCKICLQPFEVLDVDHCHQTQAIRGLLCRNCNTAIGLLKDDPARIERALQYIKETRTAPDLFNLFMRFGRC